MAKKALNGVLQQVRLLAAVQIDRACSDPELLERFVEQNDQAAFTVLVERHGPMVFGVCQRALRHTQDAEDACQATFLVFARKAGSIRKAAALGSWLHGIACRICANLKRQQVRQRQRERHSTALATQPDVGAAHWPEVQAALDEEVQKLPERYRAPLLLCYWESKTRDEAAQLLGLTPGKLHGLLERGRELLRNRLIGRGLTLSGALCASFLTAGASSAGLAPTLVVSCARAALIVAAGKPLAAGIVSTQVLVLTKEVLRNMLFTKLKVVTASILCTGLMATLIGGSFTGTGMAQVPAPKTKAAEPPATSESDEAFIRRMSTDLRGIDPTPAEVHFFVSNKDAGRRQKLIDLFIQERQAKAKAEEYLRLLVERRVHLGTRVHAALGLKEAVGKQEVNPADKAKPAAVDPLQAKRLQLEAEIKRAQADLAALAAQEKKQVDGGSNIVGAALGSVNLGPPSVTKLQRVFFDSVLAAAKEKKDVSAVTQSYLDSLIKYIKDHSKAGDVPDAMLQIELVYRALGKAVEANAWGEKLKKEYPNSPAAKQRSHLQTNSGSISSDGWIEIQDFLEIPVRLETSPQSVIDLQHYLRLEPQRKEAPQNRPAEKK
jgi:RNA polymerase sigma factor (sigma-70 family)